MTEVGVGRRAGFLIGLGLFAGIWLLHTAIESRDRLWIAIALVACGAAGLAFVLFSVIKRQHVRAAVVGPMAFLVPGIFLLREFAPDAKAALGVVTGGFVILGALNWWLAFRTERRQTELERFIYAESTSIAFFATMVGVLTYALLESFVGLPKLHAISIVVFGAWARVVAGMVVERKYI